MAIVQPEKSTERERCVTMRTLVTGATGFIGRHVTRLLTTRLTDIRVLVRTGSPLQALEGLPVEVGYGDLRDPLSLRKALAGVQQVFHVAADYRLWSKNPKEIYETNVAGTRSLIQASREAGVDRFIYTSSVATIAPPLQGQLSDESTETSLDQMIGHYKRSKFLAEREVLDAAAGGFPAVIVNPTMPVGPGDWKPTPTGRIIVDFLSGRMPAYVDTGFNVVAVEDVAEGHWLAAQRGCIGQRYILGNRNMTFKEVLDALSRVTGYAAPRIQVPHFLPLVAGYAESLFCSIVGREPRIPIEGVRMSRYKMFVDCSLARQELGFRTSSVEEALSRAAEWYIRNNYVLHKTTAGAVYDRPSASVRHDGRS
jgi:dihydroflavonol-4-reductase